MPDDVEDRLLRTARSAASSSDRRSAIVALRDMASPHLRPILLTILATERSNENLRETAIKALGAVGTEEDLPLLKAICDGAVPEPARFGRDAAKKAYSRIVQRFRRSSEGYVASSVRSAISPKTRFDVLARDQHRCVSCGRSAKEGVLLEVDHIIPVSKGGGNGADNLQTLCADCNRGKSDRHSSDLR